jgi:hypothetical protein
MKTFVLPIVSAFALMLPLSQATAQGSTAGAAASAPTTAAPARTPAAKPAPKPRPRSMNTAEQHEVNSPPLDTPPGGEVQPQISIPFGKTPPPPKNKPRTSRASGSAQGINDGAARCNAEPNEQARALCREKLRGK